MRYLGEQIDQRLRMFDHLEIQLQKASNFFRSLCRHFLCRDLDSRAKVICYLLLVRPILTYAAPIWWNISASCMEKFGRFERSCLRSALNLYRNESGERTISNAVLYNKAQIPRMSILPQKFH